jgi:hypothetical protein
MSFSWQNVIGAIAPTVATALGGPLAGLAVAEVGKVLGLDNATVDTLQATLAKAPLTADQIVALKTAELSFQSKMRELDIKEESLSYEDTKSARDMQIATKDWMPKFLAILLLAGTSALFYAVVTGSVTKDPSLAVQLGAIIGYVTGELKTVFAYYFGSSRSSEDKSTTIADIAKAQP